MPVDFRWNGPRVVAELAVRGRKASRVVADRVLERAKTNCPVDTGELKNSGHVLEDPGGRKVYVVFDVQHALPVHNGTARMQARPFLAQAVLYEKNAAFQTFQTIVKA